MNRVIMPEGPLQIRPRERQVLRMVFGLKMSNKQVAMELGIQLATVCVLVSNVTKRNGFTKFWEMYPLYLRGFIV